MKNVVLAPNPTGTGHNMRLLGIGKKLLGRGRPLNMTVLLGSRQDVFTRLFDDAGITVIDLSPTGIIDYSSGSHLSEQLSWKTMISDYFVPTFFNGDKILKYMNMFRDLQTDLIISDYNINATIAAIMMGKKNIFVTERHNFTLVDIELDDLVSGGFNVNTDEINTAKKSLKKLFNWISTKTDAIITDKVLLDGFDSEETLQNVKYNFVGSMCEERDSASDLTDFDYSQKYIIGTVSNTTMIQKDKETNIDVYISAFKELKNKIPDLKLVLIGEHGRNEDVEGIIHLPYIPNWDKLIKKSLLLISHPGWISVTEVAYLNIPTIFYLPSFMEYHEVEAFKRLTFIGVPAFVGGNSNELAQMAEEVIAGQWNKKLTNAYKILNPERNGLNKAVDIIEKYI